MFTKTGQPADLKCLKKVVECDHMSYRSCWTSTSEAHSTVSLSHFKRRFHHRNLKTLRRQCSWQPREKITTWKSVIQTTILLYGAMTNDMSAGHIRAGS